MEVSYEKLDALLKQKEITAYRLGKETGIDVAVFTAWKNGVSAPKIKKLYAIAKYFDVPLDYFVE